MSVKKFKFVSPGIFIDEIDNSQLPSTPEETGPLVIGRSQRGPALRPIKVDSFSDFVDTFGTPVPGGASDDVWRSGNKTSPMYATYAVQAWMKNNAPVTFVRLLGSEHSSAGSTQGAGAAGWKTDNSYSEGVNANGGAYGLFVIATGSESSTNQFHASTGALAAVIYVNEGMVRLSGTAPAHAQKVGSGRGVAGTHILLPAVGTKYEFKLLFEGQDGNQSFTASVNFDDTSDKYIRKVLNTNPALTNTAITTAANKKTYWLGETYDRFLQDTVGDASNAAATACAVILPLGSGSYLKHSMLGGLANSKTGWFFAQHLDPDPTAYSPLNMQKLFRFQSLDSGEWNQNNLKISVQDVKYPTNDFTEYGTFTVLIRKMEDNDKAVKVVERYSNINLNPSSKNFIARAIGDRYRTWDDTERRYRVYGDYENKSRFVRVELNEAVLAGRHDAQCLPFGVYGPPRFKAFQVHSGSKDPVIFSMHTMAVNASTSSFARTAGAHGDRRHMDYEGGMLWVGSTDRVGTGSNFEFIQAGENGGTLGYGTQYVSYAGHKAPASQDTVPFTASFLFPETAVRSSSLEQKVTNAKKAYWGYDSTKFGDNNIRYDKSNVDVLRAAPLDLSNDSIGLFDDSAYFEYSWIFSLDDLGDSSTGVVYSSGSRGIEASLTTGSWKNVLDLGYDRFTSPLYGGFDGLDITEQDPFNNTRMGTSETTSYAFNSVKRAVDSCADPEEVEFNIMTAPGITKTAITDQIMAVCEDRGDSLAIVDLEGGFTPPHENTDAIEDRLGSVITTVNSLNDRKLNSSYACAYYPWVQIKDTVNDTQLWVPPSVVALGTLSNSQKKSELWFAPAGFTRGGLTQGAAGVPVLQARERLRSEERDKLYDANINPIATFPAEGIIVFGQKTLQVTPSALDRINVRRLLIYLKKEVSKIAATTLFEPNVQVTWDRFLGKVNPFLESVKTRLGLTDYKVVLDETTTTTELIDRNILYAKVFLKPARAIEYIALDFTITNSGAAFED